MSKKRLPGFWILTSIGTLILLMLFLGQMMAFINYDFTVSLGLQESVEIIGEMGVAVNKGFGVGDTVIYIPLMLIGLTGLLLKKEWGLYAMISALGITAYWPPTCLFILIFAKGTPGFNFTNYISYTILLGLITIYGIWGIWYLYKRKNKLIQK